VVDTQRQLKRHPAPPHRGASNAFAYQQPVALRVRTGLVARWALLEDRTASSWAPNAFEVLNLGDVAAAEID
jgi:hypothetical protein